MNFYVVGTKFERSRPSAYDDHGWGCKTQNEAHKSHLNFKEAFGILLNQPRYVVSLVSYLTKYISVASMQLC